MVKVECGSQFSVALTKSGTVYTWYARLAPGLGGSPEVAFATSVDGP